VEVKPQINNYFPDEDEPEFEEQTSRVGISEAVSGEDLSRIA